MAKISINMDLRIFEKCVYRGIPTKKQSDQAWEGCNLALKRMGEARGVVEVIKGFFDNSNYGLCFCANIVWSEPDGTRIKRNTSEVIIKAQPVDCPDDLKAFDPCEIAELLIHNFKHSLIDTNKYLHRLSGLVQDSLHELDI